MKLVKECDEELKQIEEKVNKIVAEDGSLEDFEPDTTEQCFFLTIIWTLVIIRIGEEYDGIVSSITSFGMFVELDNTVEGLIRFDKLGNEYFIYDEDRKRLIGERSNKVYKIGDKVRIRVISANKLLRQIDFEIIENK